MVQNIDKDHSVLHFTYVANKTIRIFIIKQEFTAYVTVNKCTFVCPTYKQMELKLSLKLKYITLKRHITCVKNAPVSEQRFTRY
jgi:hypothetical protein